MTIVCFNTKLQQEKNSLDHSDFFSTTFDNSETKMGFDKTNTSSSSNTNTKNTNTISSNSGSSQKSSSSSAFGSFFYNTNRYVVLSAITIFTSKYLIFNI